MAVHNIKKLKNRRRELRQKETPQEKILWSKLRNNNTEYKFKRQHGIGGYILDFYCSEGKLIIELDGEIHTTKESREYDQIRDKYFKDLGYTTLRFTNREMENSVDIILIKIKNYLNTKTEIEKRKY